MRIETRGQRAAVWGAAAAMFVILMIVTPKIPQDQKYHQFADKRNFFGEWIASPADDFIFAQTVDGLSFWLELCFSCRMHGLYDA